MVRIAVSLSVHCCFQNVRTTDTSSREDDSTCESSPFREPLREEFNDGNVEQPATDPEHDTLKQYKLPHLNTSTSARIKTILRKQLL